MYAIDIEHAAKSYGDLAVLRDLNLQVHEGEVYGLLGPNGVGKSTLIHLLLGFLKLNSGSIKVLGESSLAAVRGRLGYVPERLRYHTRYSAREYLRFLGRFSDLKGAVLHERVDRELARVGLSDAADRRLGTFSKGMLQRLGIAQALLAEPDLLLIDEPTSGLDPGGQREVLDLLTEVRAHGHTILLCTHYLHEIEYLCDRVGILTRGAISAEASTTQLRVPGSSATIQVDMLSAEVRAELQALDQAVQCGERTITLRASTAELQTRVLRCLLDAGISIISLTPIESALEQLYLRTVRGAAVPTSLLPQTERITFTRATMAALPLTPPPALGRPTSSDTLLNELLKRSRANEGEDGGDGAAG